MKRKFQFLGFTLLLVFCACSTSRKTVYSDKTAELIQKQQFRVVNDWANPLVSNAVVSVNALLGPQSNAQRINLIGNPNYLEIKGDSVKAYLPYFGERHMGGGYNRVSQAIQFEQATNLQIDYIESKNLSRIRFDARDGSEAYNVILEVFDNGKTNLIVNSSQRNTIRYDGAIAALEED